MKKKMAYIALLVVATLMAAACSSTGSDSAGLETATSGGGDAPIKNILNNKEDNSKQPWTGTCTQDPKAKRVVTVPLTPETDVLGCTAEFTNTYVWVTPAVAGVLAIINKGGKCFFGTDLEIHEGGMYVVWNATPATVVLMYSDATCKLTMMLGSLESSGNQSASGKGSSGDMDTCKLLGPGTYSVGKEKCGITLANEFALLSPAFVGRLELTAVSGACYLGDQPEPMEVGKTLRVWVASRASVIIVSSPPGQDEKCELEAGMGKRA